MEAFILTTLIYRYPWPKEGRWAPRLHPCRGMWHPLPFYMITNEQHRAFTCLFKVVTTDRWRLTYRSDPYCVRRNITILRVKSFLSQKLQPTWREEQLVQRPAWAKNESEVGKQQASTMAGLRQYFAKRKVKAGDDSCLNIEVFSSCLFNICHQRTNLFC